MNKERVQKLLEHLKQLPDELFTYDEYIIAAGGVFDLRCYKFRKEPPPCGTAGCVAGHCCLLFYEEYLQAPMELATVPIFARNFLELDYFVAHALFTKYMSVATKQDAIRRLEYLLEHDGSLQGYNYLFESHQTMIQFQPKQP